LPAGMRSHAPCPMRTSAAQIPLLQFCRSAYEIRDIAVQRGFALGSIFALASAFSP